MTANSPATNSQKREVARGRSAAEQVLSHAHSGREVVQHFVPLADSVEWQLGQQYLRQRGNKAFLSDASPVPFVVNNDGSLSRNAARTRTSKTNHRGTEAQRKITEEFRKGSEGLAPVCGVNHPM